MNEHLQSLIASATMPTAKETICLRGDLVSRYAELHRRFEESSDERVSLGMSSEKSALSLQLDELVAEMRKNSIEITFRALNPFQWDEIVLEKPERGDLTETEYNNVTMLWTLKFMAKCTQSPDLSAEDYRTLVENISGPLWTSLTNTAWRLNESRMSIPF